MRWTRTDAIERIVDEFAARFPGTNYPAHGEWLRKALARFARKMLKQGYAKDIAASTEALTLRARNKALEETIEAMAERAAGCPPGRLDNCGDGPDCAACWREWGLG